MSKTTNILDRIGFVHSIDSKGTPSKIEDIEALRAFSLIDLPEEYMEIIHMGSDIECNIDNQMYIRIWGALGCIEMNEAYEVQKHISNALAIGDDEGGGVLLYLNGKDGFGVYYARFGDLDSEEAVKLAPSLTDLLINRVGVTTLLNM